MMIAVWGQNGAGKTTTAILLGLSRSRAGRSVLLVSAEDYCELPLRFRGRSLPHQSIAAAAAAPERLAEAVLELRPHLGCLGAGYMDTPLDVQMTPHQAGTLLSAASDCYEDVIIDCTAAKNIPLTGKALSLAERVLIPIPADLTAGLWLNSNARILKDDARVRFFRNETVPGFDVAASLTLSPFVTPCGTLPHYPALSRFWNGDAEGLYSAAGRNARRFLSAAEALFQEVLLP